jgi:hypothetical protein
MPTPTGLPKVGEVWELQVDILGDKGPVQRVVVLERTKGDLWALRVISAKHKRELWVGAAYWLKIGWLKYIGPAGPETRKRLGL